MTRFALGGETDVVRAVGGAAFVEHAAHFPGRTFAGNFPRAGAEDGFAVDFHPLGQSFQKGGFVFVNRAVAARRDVHQQVAVLAHDVAEHLDHRGGSNT